MTWQIAGVKKPLASVGRICDAGNVALFTSEGGFIIGKEKASKIMELASSCGEGKMEMKRENGVYNFTIKVPSKREEPQRRIMTGNRYAALAEWDRPDEEDFKDFRRQGEW